MSKVASITRAGGLIVNPQHATASTTQYARGYISEGIAVTDGLVLYLDIADYASWPGSRSLATTWSDYASHQADYDVVGDDGVILLGTYTSWQGSFTSTTTATGNHTVMFDYWSDNDNTAWSIDNDGVNNDAYNTTLDADKKKKTFSKTVNLTSTGSSTMYMRPHATGSKVYVANYRFFKEAGWNDLSGNGKDATFSGSPVFNCTNDPPIHYLTFDGTDDKVDVGPLGTSGEFSESTISIWFNKAAQATMYGNLFDCNYLTSASNKGPRMEVDSAGSIVRVYLGTDGGSYTSVSFGSLSNDVWYNAVLTAAPNSTSQDLKAYTNGALVSSSTSSSSYVWDGDIGDLYLGVGFNSSRYFTGRIAVFQIYDRVLSAAEVKQNFNAERNRFGV